MESRSSHPPARQAPADRGFLPFACDGEVIGWVRAAFAAELRRWPDWFEVRRDGVVFAVAAPGFAARSAAMSTCALALRDRGLVRGWRNEQYAIRSPRDGRTLFEIERSAVHRFGFASRGSNLNGYVGEGTSARLWIARRSPGKPIDPGMLDTMVGGGVAAGLTPWETMIKESGEEAGVPPALAGKAQPMGSVHSAREVDDGFHDETIFMYELPLPESFTPVARDGEVAAFRLTAMREVATQLVRGEFTAEAALVVGDFIDRHCQPGRRRGSADRAAP